MAGIRPDSSRRVRRPSGSGRRGFTIIEVLVAVGIITILAALTVVAVNAARGQARKTRAVSLMQSMVQATVRFEEDHGYVMPLLDGGRNEIRLPDPVLRVQNPDAWRERLYFSFSVTSPAEYLLGYGTWPEDGFGFDEDFPVPGDADEDEIPPLGIRSPGPDGFWGARDLDGNGRIDLEDRRQSLSGADGGPQRRPENGFPGRVYGPYLDLRLDEVIAVTDGTRDADTGRYRVFFPGEPGYDDSLPRVICDPWGNPIQFMRTPYAAGAPGVGLGAADYDGDGVVDPAPSLSDWVRLRPWELEVGEAADGLPDDRGSTTTSPTLQSGRFAFFSAGPDGIYAPSSDDVRTDEAETNRDNLVEVGP